MAVKDYIGYIKSPATLYVVVNIVVSFVGFLRSFAFMKWLGLEELGLISLAQTVMQFVGLFQLGLINGGYRMYSLNKVREQERVNNLLFTAFGIFLIIFLLAWGIMITTGNTILMSNDLLLIAIFAGILTLTNNWLNNTLIGKQRLKEINIINLISISVSILSLSLIYFIGFWGALISVIIHPFCYVVLALFRNVELRATGFLIDRNLIKKILSYGFIPFLSGIFVMLNLQFERWSIAGFLGNEALGRFYLVFLFNTIFMLIPNSVQSIFFPKAIRSYDEANLLEFKDIIKKFLLVTITYDAIIVVITILLLKPIVSMVFPLHVDNVKYVFLFIPGLLAWSFDSVTSLVLNASLRLKILLYAGLLGFLINIMGICLLISYDLMSLEMMACLKSIVLIIPALCSIFYILLNYKSILKGYLKK